MKSVKEYSSRDIAACSVAARRALRHGPLRPGRSVPMPSTLHYADHAERPPTRHRTRRPSISAPTHADCLTALTRRIARTATAMHPHAQRTPGSKPKQQSSCRCTRPPSRVAARPRQPAHCAHSFSRGLRGSKATAPTPRPHSALPIAAQPEHGVFRRVTTLKLKVCCLSIRDRAALPRTAPPWPSHNTARPAHSATTPNCAALPLAPHCTPPTAHCTAHATHRARPVPYCGHTARRNPMRHQASRGLSTRAGTRESLTTEYKMCAPGLIKWCLVIAGTYTYSQRGHTKAHIYSKEDTKGLVPTTAGSLRKRGAWVELAVELAPLQRVRCK